MDDGAKRLWQEHRPNPSHPVDTPCPAPWVSLEFDPSGWVLACCASHMYPLGRIGPHRLSSIWRGERAESFRQTLRRWDLTVACGPCRWHLEHGRFDPVAAVYDAYPMASADPTGPFMMQFALGNTCNLACVMCNGELSSRIRREQDQPPLESPYNEEYFDDLEPMLGDLGLVKFQGGEPFLVPAHLRVWRLLDQLATPPRQLVTTNGTVWNDTVEWVLDRFHVDISISVDAVTSETYRTMRGGNFDRLMSNIDRFEAEATRNGTSMHVSYCLTTLNWRELPAFLLWAERFASPATVNVVTDLGLALHDLPLDDLERVQRFWHEQSGSDIHQLHRNQAVWETQLRQLASVIEERRRGVGVAIRQPKRALNVGFASAETRPTDVARTSSNPEDPAAGAEARATAIALEIDALRGWSTDHIVTRITISPNGTIAAVDAPQPHRGLDIRIVGKPSSEIVDSISRADGRPLWWIDEGTLTAANGERLAVRTFALSETASRGTPGTIVRTLEFPGARTADERFGTDGNPHREVLIAFDAIYETARSQTTNLGGPNE